MRGGLVLGECSEISGVKVIGRSAKKHKQRHSLRESLKNLHKAGSHRAREPVAFSGQRGDSTPGPPILRKTHSSQSFNLVGVGVLLGLRFCTLVSPGELLKSLMSRLHPPQLSSAGETQASKSSKVPSDSDMWQRVRTSVLDLSSSCSPDPS